jgi:FkbM family methyltransferase
MFIYINGIPIIIIISFHQMNITSINSFHYYTLDNCIISKQIKGNEPWEPYMNNVFEKYINKNSVVIECGCHIGVHTVKIASLCKKIYGFEPMPNTYQVLAKNIRLNGIQNAVLYKKGVADKPGMTKYAWSIKGNPGGSGLANNPIGIPSWCSPMNEDIPVELITIDSMDLDQLDFMKLDVEGYEPLVIKGAINTITKYKPVIVMEIWKSHYTNETDLQYVNELFKDLIDIGYVVEYLEGVDFIFLPGP